MNWEYQTIVWVTNTTNTGRPPADDGTHHWDHPTQEDLTLCGKYDPLPATDDGTPVTCPDCLFLEAHDLCFGGPGAA